VTEIGEDMFIEFLRDLAPRFTQQTYNVLSHNCNNFTDEVAQILTGEGIPKDIVDLPKTFLATPMGQSFAPMI
jgi:desumoylating isopeptidase 1